MVTATEARVDEDEAIIHVLWINAGLSCDGDSVALTAATQPSIDEIAMGALPGLPKIAVHRPLVDFEVVLIDVDQPGSVPAPPARGGAGPTPIGLGTKPRFVECPGEVVSL